jgi:hypothetical protein
MSCTALAGAKRYSCDRRLSQHSYVSGVISKPKANPVNWLVSIKLPRPKERNVAVEGACTELQVSSTGHSPCQRKTRRYYQKESVALSRIGQGHAQRQGRRPGRRRHIWCSSKVAQVWASGRDRIMRPCLSLAAS